MKIGIYGGSFNPVHKGHIQLAQYGIKHLNLDKLFFVPANVNPFKKVNNYVNNQHRINMINLVLEDKMFLSDFEVRRGGTSYTIDTIKYFKQKYPNDELFLFIGTDNIPSLNKWKNIEEISELSQIVAFNRNNKFSKINVKKYKVQILNNPVWNYSSTQYRNGQLDIVNEKVQEYIGTNFLYFEDIAKGLLFDIKDKEKQFRYFHLAWTGEFAAKLAQHLKCSIKNAYQAGYAHDITKNWTEDASYKFLEQYGYTKENLENYKLHQTTAYYWLRDIYKYNNDEVLNAIKKHTSLDLDLTLLDKILYVADKISKGRRWEGIEKIRNLCFEDFDKAFKYIVTRCAEYESEVRGCVFSEHQKMIYKKWGN
ncbi:nicotinate-nucleotide adenylyltransferase [Mycoplasma enhydrae]|uniref:nicotinate-nucleotide adenylyltransferase n=1 Tax=Mycoplasma enhydrae TaxID=2499220 RepID=UPI00197B1F98|nr:nicotinate-nucleotide adenylyltransferase [Mycoplasma enhydrae]MBN4089406.1 nicotinate-nucleotide adenylyltransferase [Mycoplasma enhydrae]MCV3733462.1 nicotinate-nucleotide adenylyltransferase [Mycoplasma enhydrae]